MYLANGTMVLLLEQDMEAFVRYSELNFGRTPEPRPTRLLQMDPKPIRAAILQPREDGSSVLPSISIPCLLYSAKMMLCTTR